MLALSGRFGDPAHSKLPKRRRSAKNQINACFVLATTIDIASAMTLPRFVSATPKRFNASSGMR
jgi:hypothetical protein